MRNNNFTYHHDGERSNDQIRCPFAAHTRKVRPRADFTPEDPANHIIRAGIPYGPEGQILFVEQSRIVAYRMFTVTPEESQSNKTSTSLERGLAFGSFECFRVNERWLIDATTVAYQSNINLGFRFLQQVWINNAKWGRLLSLYVLV